MVEPFACALYSLEVCRVQPGASVAIVGAGPMGLTHLLLANAMGASRVILSDPVPERRAIAKDLGATQVVDSSPGRLMEAVLDHTHGLGADVVIVSVGNVEAIEVGLGVARKQGFINIFGGCPPESIIRLDPNLIHYSELFLTGTQNAPVDHYRRAVEVLSVLPRAEDLITQRLPLVRIGEAFQTRLEMEGLKTVIDF